MAEFTYLLKMLHVGEGIGRIMMNEEIHKSVELSGVVLDIGGGKQPSYSRLLVNKPSLFIVMDIILDKSVDVVGSITRLPLRSNSVDYVLCFNVLEHVFDYTSALSEIRRVLKPGGILYGRVPFLFGIHEDPSDYWRYTKESLRELLARASFVEVSIKTHGGLFLVILNLLSPILRIGIFRFVCAAIAITMNYVFSIIVGDARNRERYPLGYFFTARNPLGLTQLPQESGRGTNRLSNDAGLGLEPGDTGV